MMRINSARLRAAVLALACALNCVSRAEEGRDIGIILLPAATELTAEQPMPNPTESAIPETAQPTAVQSGSYDIAPRLGEYASQEPASTPEPVVTPEPAAAPEATGEAGEAQQGGSTGIGRRKPQDVSTTDSASTAAPDATETPSPAPTETPGRLQGLFIGLDPGHQTHANSEKEPLAPGSSAMKKKVSSGTQGVVTRVEEYKLNLIIALQLRDRLEAEGARVIMTRETDDVNISNVERAQLMNDAGVDIWLRIHCNGSDNHSANGIGTYVRATGPAAYESYDAGQMLSDALSARTGAKNNGVHSTDTYSGNNWSNVPCVLVEMGYMSNPDEDRLLNTPEYQQKLIEGYIDAMELWNERYNRPHILQPETDGRK